MIMFYEMLGRCGIFSYICLVRRVGLTANIYINFKYVSMQHVTRFLLFQFTIENRTFMLSHKLKTVRVENDEYF